MLWWILGIYAALTVVAFLVGMKDPMRALDKMAERAMHEDGEMGDRMPFGLLARFCLWNFWGWCFYPWTRIAFYLPGGTKKRALLAKKYITEKLEECNVELQEELRWREEFLRNPHELRPLERAPIRDDQIPLFFKSHCETRRRWDYREVAEKNLYAEFSAELFPLTQFQYWRSLVWQTFAFLGWPGPACVGLWMGIQAAWERRKYSKEED